MKLLYPTNIVLDIDSLKGFAPSLHPYDVDKPIPEDLVDAEIIVTWSNKADNLKDAVSRMKNLKWIQSLSAGPNDVLNAGFDSSVVITSGSGLHDHTVAEHTLALLLCAARRLDEMTEYKLQGKWSGHLGGPQPDRPEGRFTSLRGANVTIWGFGNIAKNLTPALRTLGANVRGIARSQGVRDGVEVYSDRKLEEILPQTDALVMILPGAESTKHALNSERLKQLPKHAWVVNVGRGTSIDENALADALEKEEIGGAALDVFEQEPLPDGHRFYKTPNTIISPHAAGGRPQGAEELITWNLRRFLAGQELKNKM
jgi:phosphoglycerate dehydrogenase-like enzyme